VVLGRRCMRCGSTYRVEVDHIIARARGEFGREYQWMPRNLQILCREHNQEKMIKFDDWRPLWARVLMPVRDTPEAHRAKIRAAFNPHEYRRAYATTPLQAVEVGCSDPLSPYPGNTQRSCNGLRNKPGLVDLSEQERRYLNCSFVRRLCSRCRAMPSCQSNGVRLPGIQFKRGQERSTGRRKLCSVTHLFRPMNLGALSFIAHKLGQNIKAQMLCRAFVPYFHVVFSLPALIADIAYQNKAVIYGILFKASAETLLTIAADPKHLGARIGITSVLHTWGSALTHHPHAHIIVAAASRLTAVAGYPPDRTTLSP
jgi:hypothetical protein